MTFTQLVFLVYTEVSQLAKIFHDVLLYFILLGYIGNAYNFLVGKLLNPWVWDSWQKSDLNNNVILPWMCGLTVMNQGASSFACPIHLTKEAEAQCGE